LVSGHFDGRSATGIFLEYKENDKNLSATKKSSIITTENRNFDGEKPWSSDERIYVPMNAAAAMLGDVHLGMRPKPSRGFSTLGVG
jgi:hypothetical protein